MATSFHRQVPNPNDYDPISNLKKQNEPRAAILIIQLESCIEQGIVDTILKSQTTSTPNGIASGTIETSMKNLSVSDATTASDNPFDFLGEQVSVVSSNSSTNLKKGPTRSSKFFGKMKNHIDRGIHSIANNVQKATGDEVRRDLLNVGAYIQNPITGEMETLGLTESIEVPDSSNNGILTFQIPIVIPSDALNESNIRSGAVIQLYLWARSGAVIFAKNRALRRYLFVGNATLRIANLAKIMQPAFTRPINLSLALQSSYINSGKMSVVVTPDLKHPSLCGQGWSLTDPRVDMAYTKSSPMKRMLFNRPLDQSYAFSTNEVSPTTNHFFLATERATESSIVLPTSLALVQLFSKAANHSAQHANNVAEKLQSLQNSTMNNPMKAMQLGHAQCQVDVLHFLRHESAGNSRVKFSINLQKADSIFEDCLANGELPCFTYVQNMRYPTNSAASIPFYPRIVGQDDPRLISGDASKQFQIGFLRIQLHEDSVGDVGGDKFTSIGPSGSILTKPRNLEALVDLDAFVNVTEQKITYLNVVDIQSGISAGVLGVVISVSSLEGLVENPNNTSSRSEELDFVEGGLIGMVGLSTLMDDEKACYPYLDVNRERSKQLFQPTANPESDRRTRQLATMGEFISSEFLKRHSEDRRRDFQSLLDKEVHYLEAVTSPADENDDLPPDKRRDPRPFRPSSCRLEPLLSSIGFNIHLQTFTLTSIAIDNTNNTIVSRSVNNFQSTTCGAPSDHYRGFSGKGEDKGFSGGLRRLESSRFAASEKLRLLQRDLINAVSQYYSRNQNMETVKGRSKRHIPPSELQIGKLRNECRLATEKLNDLTWDLAVRRANVFSQALGIALTCYLSQVSDLSKAESGAAIWKQHGFLIAFEGLLSAAGKELGMIEDASIGICMLRMVSVVLVTDDNPILNEKPKIQIPDSTYLHWMRIHPSGHGSDAKFLVEFCVDKNYYIQRVPDPLRNQTSIQFFPLLYQMGVDIRQWGANAGANFGKSRSGDVQEDVLDEDEIGIPDSDFLIQLNHEAFRKMNAYSHLLHPVEHSINNNVSWESAHFDQQLAQPVHPMLTSLYNFIRSSAGKMEHGVLDEAGIAASKLRGGTAIFCKSGKDRTAMQVTYKQSQFLNKHFTSEGNEDYKACAQAQRVFDDATLMRVYGTRLPICEKNVGQSLYAFNSLQARFMPDPLKPPPRALAGFLKGGRVFSGGAIES